MVQTCSSTLGLHHIYGTVILISILRGLEKRSHECYLGTRYHVQKWIQWRATKIVVAEALALQEEAVAAGLVEPGGRMSLGHLTAAHWCWWEETEEMQLVLNGLNSRAWWEDRRWWAKVQTREVQMNIRRKSLPYEGSEAMDPAHREVVPFLPLEVFKPQLGKTPGNLFWSHSWPCFGQEVGLEASWGPLPLELAYHSWTTTWLKCQIKAQWCVHYPAPCLPFQNAACDYIA